MIRLWTLAFLLLAGLIVIPAGQSSAQVKYVDEQGNTHYAQSDSMVPEQYWAKAKPIGPLPTVRAEGAQSGRPYTGLCGGYGNSGPSMVEREAEQNAQRMRSAAEQNLLQKRQDQAKKDAYHRCVGSTPSGGAGSSSYGSASPSCF